MSARPTASSAGPSTLRPVASLLVGAVLDRVDTDVVNGLDRDDLPLVLAAAGDHRITPAVARWIARADGTPAEWSGPLNAHRHAQLFRHMQAGADLRALAEALAPTGIRWVIGKGPAAADLIWPHSDMREYYDVDVFVDARDFGIVLESLLSSGFELADRNWPEMLRTMRAELALTGPAGTHLDLHWDIAVVPELRDAFRIPMRQMLDRAVPARLGSGVDVHVFDPVDTMFHLAFHAAQAGANRLMWIGDIHHASTAEGFEWGELEFRSEAARIELPLALILERVRRTLGFPVDPPASLLKPAEGWWGRLSKRRDERSPFPDLPGDKSRGGLVYSSARPTVRATIRHALASGLRVRQTERRVSRRGPDERILYRDVPDDGARQAYMDAVRSNAS